MKQARALRNNNPLNIRRGKSKWQGTRTDAKDKNFEEFISLAFGWRAAFILLCKTYYARYHLRTMREIITKWAPLEENNTAAYIDRVAELSGLRPDTPLPEPHADPVTWLLIGAAMAVVESGETDNGTFSMLKGWMMAGI